MMTIMENKKRKCIFHIPNKLDETGMSGSQVRPRKMLAAFKSIGYDVDVVMGYGAERKASIKEIKKKINSGVKYDFIYSESSTMPTLLTEKNHLPKYPTLDFGFFKFCKKRGVKIGLFYRDMYWKFPIYHESVSGIKYYAAILLYKYDLKQYAKMLDKFYVPNNKIEAYLNDRLCNMIEELPPGCEKDIVKCKERESFFLNRLNNFDQKLNLFYVGGLGGQYDFEKLIKGIRNLSGVYLTICCREREWEENKERLLPYFSERIKIVHKSGKALDELYAKADICMAYFKPDEYREMAMPIKLFEYISNLTPVIASTNTATSSFVEKNHIGWCIDYSESEIHKLL